MAMPFNVAAFYSLLLDSVWKYESRKGLFLPEVLEQFWGALADSEMEDLQKENLLHRLAELYSHGSLRIAHAQRLARLLPRLGTGAVLDPFAGTGLHMKLLAEHGLRTEAADARPSERGVYWVGVAERGVDGTPWERYGAGWALFVSWAPHWSDAGQQALQAFQGDVVVVLGDDGKWTGTDSLFRELARGWAPVDGWPAHGPWPRAEEHLLVLARRGSAAEARATEAVANKAEEE